MYFLQVYHRDREFYCGSGEMTSFDDVTRRKERLAFKALLQSTVIQVNYTLDGEYQTLNVYRVQ
jgi:hypothetical protein